MIGYVTLGTNDLDRSARFFDAFLAEFGATRAYTLDRMIAWSVAPDKPLLVATLPSDGAPANPGNGTMVALICESTEHVTRAHQRALALGGEDAGAPAAFGPEFFGGYVRDPDGNKLCLFVMQAPAPT
ncbi:VOC family protein [Gymnodinialimonas sp. 2305UL16-5]|uniref:VOC family protein n=1 Tax=Gymnodinialimonas mytili TaxID=3126503 RepID=UPI0030AAD28E